MGYKKLMDNARLIRETCRDVITKRRNGETQSLGKKADLLDLMLNSTDPRSGQQMDEEMIIDNVLTFLFAGQDSTATAMASCLCFLNAQPECKRRLLQEINDVVGEGQIEWEHLGKMKYLDWCIKETM